MEYIYVGKITNTHGLKGEIRILSQFPYIGQVMIPNFYLYIGSNYKQVKIVTHRIHKEYHMVTLEGYDSIEQVQEFKGEKVYFNREDLHIKDYFDEDYLGLKADSNRFLGTIVDIIHGKAQDLLVIEKEHQQFYVPKVDAFIQQIDLQKKEIKINEIEGLFDEN